MALLSAGRSSGAGWLAYVIDEAALYSFNGTSWIKSGLQLESYLDLSEISPPSNPGADVGRLYVKDVGGTTKLAFKDHAGTETVVGSGGGAIVPPQGRLTLTSAVPVLTADATAATTIYYTPYRGTSVPLYDGSAWSNNELAEISLALDSSSGHTGYHQSGKTFDLFVFDDAGTKRLGSGPAWSSDSSRGTGAGTTELTLRNGLLVNANSITARFGASSGNTVSVAANKATYVGSFRASADGQTQFKLGTISSSAAAAAINVWNAYNRRSIKTKSGTTTDTWTYNSTTPRLPNGEAIQASVLQGWLEEPVSANYHARANTTASSSSSYRHRHQLDLGQFRPARGLVLSRRRDRRQCHDLAPCRVSAARLEHGLRPRMVLDSIDRRFLRRCRKSRQLPERPHRGLGVLT